MYSDTQIKNEYERWKQNAVIDSDLIKELDDIKNNYDQIKERFYKDLEFGTGGLRGIIGAGTNRMNIYTVARTTQGFSNYLNARGSSSSLSAAISYDSRIKSKLFAKTTACVFAANGIHAYIYKELMPTPALSFAVRYLKADAGVMITASHNPCEYNGYKAYGSDGGQLTLEDSQNVLDYINATDIFNDIKIITFEEGLNKGYIHLIDDKVTDEYIKNVSLQAINKNIDKNASIVYTPLNGAGLKCVMRALNENGYNNIKIVEEQKEANGNFPTCPYPNPEQKQALERGLILAEKTKSGLLIATDPDCDRCAVAVRVNEEYELLSGNQMGLLMFEYICSQRTNNSTMPASPVAVKTIVSTRLIENIAREYGVRLINVLTGFKFIGEQIGLLEDSGLEKNYIFGFEESYGYLTGSYVRDKDAVNAALIISEMYCYYKQTGMNLVDVLNNLYEKYGYCMDTVKSYTFEGADGFSLMKQIMNDFRKKHITNAGGKKLVSYTDYISGKTVNEINGEISPTNLPSSDVVKFEYEDSATVIIRPSGTEPKIKLYFSVTEKNKQKASAIIEDISIKFDKIICSYK